MIDDEQFGFRADRGCVDQIFIKQIGEKKVYVGFIDLEKAYDGVNRKTGNY